MTYQLEFANDADSTECDACGAVWCPWSSAETVEECVAEADRQNAEWEREGSNVLAWRIVTVVRTG
jgi:uncharacterized OB-fold protein